MNTLENTISVRLSREEIKLLLKALASAPSGQADMLLWRLAELQQECESLALPPRLMADTFLQTAR